MPDAVSRRLASNKTGAYTARVFKSVPVDPQHRQELRGYDRSYKDFLAELNRQRGRFDTDYAWTVENLKDQGKLDREDIEDDFSGRGILRSGVYADRLNRYNTEYGKRQQELGRQKTRTLTDFLTQKTNFEREQELQREASKLAATRRASQRKMGIF